MTHMITWTEFDHSRDACTIRHLEARDMTKQEVLNAVAEWYDAMASYANVLFDSDGIQLLCIKKDKVN